MAQLLTDRFHDRIEFALPDGGLAIWVLFNDKIDMDELTRVAREKGVQILSAAAFTVSGKPIRATRLGFASLNEAELDLRPSAWVRRLARWRERGSRFVRDTPDDRPARSRSREYGRKHRKSPWR